MVVSISSAKVRYKALAQSICEGLWLKRLPEELRVLTIQPMTVFFDSLDTISIAKNPIHHDRTKHYGGRSSNYQRKIEVGIPNFIHTLNHL